MRERKLSAPDLMPSTFGPSLPAGILGSVLPIHVLMTRRAFLPLLLAGSVLYCVAYVPGVALAVAPRGRVHAGILGQPRPGRRSVIGGGIPTRQ